MHIMPILESSRLVPGQQQLRQWRIEPSWRRDLNHDCEAGWWLQDTCNELSLRTQENDLKQADIIELVFFEDSS
jgi:hypothetical protein